MVSLRTLRRIVFVGSVAMSIAAGLAMQFSGVIVPDVRLASTGELILVLVLIAAPVSTLAAAVLLRGGRAMARRHHCRPSRSRTDGPAR